ncbi:UDP-2,3-diacylglucosamine diphosphatase [Bordetella sp. FB-8]|uniref:UDP-2,3-diacylglucosamine diphosphatase n=1 Tax=Bordetella sp. FB-8 TaxID=1159870 RepID=UPI000362DAB2|nr:UDP-2,3-diacylglucosamine diphosphatase [Bordetella sp. FB-8]
MQACSAAVRELGGIDVLFESLGSTHTRSLNEAQTEPPHRERPAHSKQPASLASQPTRVRALFLSDLHLGTRGCQAELLLEFLRQHDADTIFLIGDIVEGRRLKSRRRWAERHRAVMAELFAKVHGGTRIVYVPGNHDQLLRQYAGLHLGGIEIALNAIHETLDGRRFLVTHGDQFDVVLHRMPWLACAGHTAYHGLLALNAGLNMIRRRIGLGHWSLSAWAKYRVKRVVNYISHFEDSLVAQAQQYGAHGIVCGHIHHPSDHLLGEIRYLNTGDWVESCSGIVEHEDGRFELLCWHGQTGARQRRSGWRRFGRAAAKAQDWPTEV